MGSEAKELSGAFAGGLGSFLGGSLLSFGRGLLFSRQQCRAAAQGGVALEVEKLSLRDRRGGTFHQEGKFCRGSF